MKPKQIAFLACTAAFLASCATPPKGAEPSESFRKAFDEVMAAQPGANKIKPDLLETRRDPVILNLSLTDCLTLASQNNRTILLEQLNAEAAAANVMAAKANLDFVIGASVGYSREVKELQSLFPGDSRTREVNGISNYGINASLPFATGTTADITVGFTRNDSNSPFQAFEFYPTADLKITQSLLNGFGFTPNLGPTWVAENDRDSAELQLRVTRNNVAFEVATAYWNLVSARQELDVLYAQRDLALDSLELAKSRLEAEIGTRLDVIAQEANLKSQDLFIIQAETLVETRADELLKSIHPDLLYGYARYSKFRYIIEPTTEVDTEVGSENLEVLEELKAALRRRPEITQSRKRIENAGINIDVAEYGLLPTLDLNLDFGVNGFGKSSGDSVDSLMEFKNTSYGFGVTFGIPLQNRRARSGAKLADIEMRNAILAARELETGIILEVNGAVRQVRSARRQVESASEARRLQEET
ncbi:MAG: TolC family protein, partial [Planctomycetota bacterium]